MNSEDSNVVEQMQYTILLSMTILCSDKYFSVCFIHVPYYFVANEIPSHLYN